jgi:hypothetical protein
MSITIRDTLLNYKIINKNNKDKYIITYIEEYNILLDTYLNNIFNIIFPHYDAGALSYSNVCGDNAEFICNKLKNTRLEAGKIIITEWVTKNWVIKNEELIETIESVYGRIGTTIGSSYHALAYLTVIIEKTNYYVAIETTICVPYKLQFYVGSNKEEFEKIITTRYQCSNFKISFDCDKSWQDIAYNRGGKNKKTKKQKNKKNKKTKKRKQKWAF